MTLNVTVLTETRIYQSSDFRLSTPDGPLDIPTMKLVRLSYPTFDGLVSYTGLAKESINSPSDTADRIVEWLSDSQDMRLFQVVELIESRATQHVADIERRTGHRHPLTIVAAAFIGDRPRAAIISNFQDTLGQTSLAPASQMTISWAALKPGAGPIVLITGNKGAVTATEQMELLQTILESGEDSRRVRAAIHSLNRTASANPTAKQTISSECTVVSMDSSGAGMQDVDSLEGIDLKDVHNGSTFDLSDIIRTIGIHNAQVVGASFATSKPTTRGPASCRREVWDVADSGFRMIEILHVTDLDCTPLGISDEGVVLGTHSEPSDRGRHQYWTWSEENTEELNYLDLDPTQIQGGCVNSEGNFAILHGSQTSPRILVYESGRLSRELEVPAGMGEPGLGQLTNSGMICGWISINQDNTDSDRVRPAYWDPDGAITVLDQMSVGTNGRAVGITAEGVILVWANYSAFGRATLIWDPSDGSVQHLHGDIIPIAIANNGVVVGFDRNQGRDAAVISFDQTSWTRLPVNNGFAPAACNDALTLVGNVRMDEYMVGWAMPRDGVPLILPSYRYHEAHPRHINSEGQIVGQLAADYEQHVVLWTRVS